MVYAYQPNSVTVSNSTFQNNTINAEVVSTGSVFGGLFYMNEGDGTVSFSSVTVEGNSIESTDDVWGGVFYSEAGEIEIDFDNTIFRTNTVSGESVYGGIVSAYDFISFNLQNSEFSSNDVQGSNGIAGAVINVEANTLGESLFELENVTIAHNYTHGDDSLIDGTVYIAGSSLIPTIRFSTIAFNTLGNPSVDIARGGGIYIGSNDLFTPLTVVASVFDNAAVQASGDGAGQDCYNANANNLSSGNFNVIKNTTDCNFVAAANDVVGEAPLLESLADNGGFSQTAAITELSPAYNLVSGDLCVGKVDQRGFARSTSTCDSGAFELTYFYTDADGDGFGDSTTETTVYAEALVADNTDCDDVESDISPDDTEICSDSTDNDCDGDIDLDDADCVVDTGDDDDEVAGDEDDEVTGDDDDDDVVVTCGDGTLDAIEECDDGNIDADDGCSATCTTEVDEDTSSSGGSGCSLMLATQPQTNMSAAACIASLLLLLSLRLQRKLSKQVAQY